MHRGMQLLVAQAVVWFCVAWPYILFLLQQMALYERRYKISEKFVGRSIELANSFARYGMSASIAVCRMGDGKVGQVLTDALSWTIQGMAGGFSDGVEDGWSRVGATG